MSPNTVTAETLKQITHLAAALKAPRITESAARLADHARDAGWTHEDYLAAVLDREVAARNASGAQLRICAAGMPAVNTVEDFNLDQQPPARTPIQALASGAYLTEHRNVVLLGPSGTGKTHLVTALGVAAYRQGHRVLFATATDWVTRLSEAHDRGRLRRYVWDAEEQWAPLCEHVRRTTQFRLNPRWRLSSQADAAVRVALGLAELPDRRDGPDGVPDRLSKVVESDVENTRDTTDHLLGPRLAGLVHRKVLKVRRNRDLVLLDVAYRHVGH